MSVVSGVLCGFAGIASSDVAAAASNDVATGEIFHDRITDIQAVAFFGAPVRLPLSYSPWRAVLF